MFDSTNLYRPGVPGGDNRSIYGACTLKEDDNEPVIVQEGMVAFNSLGHEFIIAMVVEHPTCPGDSDGDEGKRFVVVCWCLSSYP
mgnify:FL=1